MNNPKNNNLNKDLILRERLALERTAMGNDRTLLAFILIFLHCRNVCQQSHKSKLWFMV